MHAAELGRGSRRTSLIIALCCMGIAAIAWGGAFLFIKVAVRDLSPSVVAASRCTIAALVLWTIRLISGPARPSSADAVGAVMHHRVLLAITAGSCTAAAFWLIGAGELSVSSGLTGIVLASVPVWTITISSLIGGSVTFRVLAACVLGTAAVVVITMGDRNHATAAGLLLLVLAALGHASSNVALQLSLVGRGPVRVAAETMTVAALVLTPAAVLTAPGSMPGVDSVISVVVLGVCSTAIAYLAFLHAVRVLGANVASFTGYLLPTVAVAAGAIWLGEVLTWRIIVSSIIAIASIAIAVRTTSSERQPSAPIARNEGRPAA